MLRWLARKHVILWLGALPLLAVALSTLRRFNYDDGGIGSILFVVTATLGAPFHKAAELIRESGGDQRWIWPVALIVGYIPYLFADWLLLRFAQWRERFHAEAGA
jgi:hypothetical protein